MQCGDSTTEGSGDELQSYLPQRSLCAASRYCTYPTFISFRRNNLIVSLSPAHDRLTQASKTSIGLDIEIRCSGTSVASASCGPVGDITTYLLSSRSSRLSGISPRSTSSPSN